MNTIKKSLLVELCLMLISGLFVSQVFAEAITTTVQPTEAGQMKVIDRVLTQGVKPSGKLEQNTTNLKARAESEIDKRLTSLNELLSRISSITRLTAAQKSSFTSQVQTQITNLTALRTKIDADTDTATLKTDVQSIVQSYRIYALFIPQVHLLAAANEVLNAVDKLTSAETVLQSAVDQAKSGGKDVTVATAALTDMQAKVADAKTQAQSVLTNVSALTPEGYPGNKTTMQTAQTSLKAAKADIEAAIKDTKTIMQTVRGEKTPMTSTVTPTP